MKEMSNKQALKHFKEAFASKLEAQFLEMDHIDVMIGEA